jgi:hypothetical protein
MPEEPKHDQFLRGHGITEQEHSFLFKQKNDDNMQIKNTPINIR